MKTVLFARAIVTLINSKHATEATLRALGRSGARLKFALAEARGGSGILEAEFVGSESRIEAMENIAASLAKLPIPAGPKLMTKPGSATHRILVTMLSREDLDRALIKIGELSQIEKIVIDDLSRGKGRAPVYSLVVLTVINCSLALASIKRELADFALALRVVTGISEIRAGEEGAPVAVSATPPSPAPAAAKVDSPHDMASPPRVYRRGKTAGLSSGLGSLVDVV